jgi:hypothetical protein
MIMLVVCAMNLIWAHRRAEGRSQLDGRRLQAALTEELSLLADLYRSNLDLLDKTDVRLLSTRMPMAVYRANLGRLNLIEENLVRRLVAVHAKNEHLEMLVAERAKMIKAGQCTVYVFEKDDPSLDDLRARFTMGIQHIEAAIETLEADLVPTGLPTEAVAAPDARKNVLRPVTAS